MSGFRVNRVQQIDARRIRAQRGSATPKILGGVLLGAAGAAAGEALFAHRKVNGATQLERVQSHLSTLSEIAYAWNRGLPALEGFTALELPFLAVLGLKRLFRGGRKAATPGSAPLPHILQRITGPHSIAAVSIQQAVPKPSDGNLKIGSEVKLDSVVYVIEKQLGAGGMGTVWKARNNKGEPVAVKQLKIDNPDARARFRREAEIIEGIGKLPRRQDGEWDPKDGVVGYKGFEEVEGTNKGNLFMEYVDGKPLGEFCEELRKAYIQELAMETGAKLRQVQLAIVTLFHYIGLSLQEAFLQKNIIHRDLKLDNVLVAIDRKRIARPKILDWGLAKDVTEYFAQAGQAGLTQDGSFLGTMSFAAPEVFWAYRGLTPKDKTFKRSDVTIQADMYSLGVMLYSVLVGKHPFKEQNQVVDFYQLHTDSQEPQLIIPEIVPPKTGELLRRLLARYPQDRPQDYAEFIALIEAAESEILGLN
ncbi:serine/threonine protein kinase [Candidatus Saganbacteria bacterium]|nr:serine/threonine protein kinase [Candidatus Saganbacteria bacterium]